MEVDLKKYLFDLKGCLAEEFIDVKLTSSQSKMAKIKAAAIIAEVRFKSGDREKLFPLLVRHLKKLENVSDLEISVRLLRTITTYLAMIKSKKRLKKYKELLKLKVAQLNDELELEQMYESLLLAFVQSAENKESYIEKLEDYIGKIELKDNPLSLYSEYCKRIFNTYLLSIRKNHHELIEHCQDSIDFFDKQKASTVAMRFTFRYNIIWPYMHTLQYDKAEHTINDCITYCSGGNRNWHKLHRLMVIVYFHQGQFDKALAIYNKTPRYVKSADPDCREDWQVVKGYLQILKSLDILEIEKDYRINSIVNDFERYDKDKRGHNTNIIIIALCLSIIRKTDYIENNKENISVYCSNHLDPASKACIFIRKLLKIHYHDYDLEKFKKFATKELDEKINHEIEVFPYSKLIELVEKTLR